VGAAADDRQEVDQAGRAETPRDVRHVGRRKAVARKLVTRDAGAYDEVIPDPTPNLSQHFNREAHSILETAAVVVEALVEEG